MGMRGQSPLSVGELAQRVDAWGVELGLWEEGELCILDLKELAAASLKHAHLLPPVAVAMTPLGGLSRRVLTLLYTDCFLDSWLRPPPLSPPPQPLLPATHHHHLAPTRLASWTPPSRAGGGFPRRRRLSARAAFRARGRLSGPPLPDPPPGVRRTGRLRSPQKISASDSRYRKGKKN